MTNTQTLLLYDLTPLLQQAILTQTAQQTRLTCVLQPACSQQQLLDRLKKIQATALILSTMQEDHFQKVKFIRQLRHHLPRLAIYCYTDCQQAAYLTALLESGVTTSFRRPFSIEKFQRLMTQLTSQLTTPTFVQSFQKLVLSQNFLKATNGLPALCQQLFMASGQHFPETQLNELLTVSWRLLGIGDQQQQQALQQSLQAQTSFYLMTPLEVEFYLFELVDLVFKQRISQQQASLQKCFDYIDFHLYEDLIVGDVAVSCQVSANYLGRLFTERLGVSLNNYIQIRKIQLAKIAFYFNEEKVIDVGYRLAYNEPGYFSKVFKKFTQITPSQYKKQVAQVKQRLEVCDGGKSTNS